MDCRGLRVEIAGLSQNDEKYPVPILFELI
jgi:hypothetical protein